MTKNTINAIKWSIITLTMFSLFFWLIPVDIYAAGLYFFVIVGAVGLTYSFFKMISFILRVINERKSVAFEEKGIRNIGGMLFVSCLVVFFLSAILFLIREIQIEDNELTQYGVVTTGTITNGKMMATRKMDLSYIIVGFAKKSGDSAFVTTSISKGEFNNYYRGQTVLLIYSTRYPTIFKTFFNFKELDEYEKNNNRK
ncbi:hypothetical protein KXQ82_18110 [Mucilaginibacter sp. HMF5004]|uniref:hypothetical protein n=1 Tax=Mucilaginibacter rivuli TaxID=2857527 RepID=UPI001C5ECAB0|nr:hypothetical protein [Mucilaginibacter rivuli]MBW4891646.1 hypothetical protein [Mucilaginibacter rivuli]